jgi:hypothetical protein
LFRKPLRLPIPIPPKPTQPIATLLLGALEPNTEHGTTDGMPDITRAETPALTNPLRVIFVFMVVIIASLAIAR